MFSLSANLMEGPMEVIYVLYLLEYTFTFFIPNLLKTVIEEIEKKKLFSVPTVESNEIAFNLFH